jgi:hypothetical protein
MATIVGVITNPAAFGDTLKLVTWSALTTTNSDGSPFEFQDWADRCVQVFGTFGAGGSVSIQGSNDGTNWATLNDSNGTALTFTAAGIKQALETAVYIRPKVTAGDGTTSLTVTVSARRIWNVR